MVISCICITNMIVQIYLSPDLNNLGSLLVEALFWRYRDVSSILSLGKSKKALAISCGAISSVSKCAAALQAK